MKKFLLKTTLGLAGLLSLTPASQAQNTVYGLNTGGVSLSTFEPATPGTITNTIPITLAGGNLGETITAIDFRPADRQLYGYSSSNRLFTIDITSGAGTLFSSFPTVTPTAPNGVGSDSPSAFPPTAQARLDFNPVPNALRITSSTDRGNLRLTAGNVLMQDDTLTFAGGGTPNVVSVAYTNPDTLGTTGTVIYYLDSTTDSIFTAASPNDGVLSGQVVLTLAGAGTTIDIPTTNVGFDVPLFGTDLAYASINGTLYSFTVGTVGGSASSLGAIGASVTDIAVIPEPSTYLMIALGLGSLLLVNRKRAALRA